MQVNKQALIASIQPHFFPPYKYYKTAVSKTQIVLHHTVSGLGVIGDLSWWLQCHFRIGTAFIIDRKGIIHQCFNSSRYAKHLGVKQSFLNAKGIKKTGGLLDAASIGIELDSWGALAMHKGKFYPIDNFGNADSRKPTISMHNVEIYETPHRGFKYFEKYTNAQLQSMSKLCAYLCKVYDIKTDYLPEMWNVSKRALSGENGIYTHASFRADKSDCHPQMELINAIKQIKKYRVV